MNNPIYTKYLEEVKDLHNEEQEKALALAMHLQLVPEENQTLDDFLSQLTSTEHDKNAFMVDNSNEEYLVLTDEEADIKEDEYLENFIDDCVLHEIPETYRFYFDSEKFKDDAKINGRGHSLAGYDGYEKSEDVNGTTYYIYRIN